MQMTPIFVILWTAYLGIIGGISHRTSGPTQLAMRGPHVTLIIESRLNVTAAGLISYVYYEKRRQVHT